jgi:hypothetical protein
MEHQRAIELIREHLTILHSNPNIYEDGTNNVIYALEDFAIPALEKEIPKKVELYPCKSEWGRRYIGCPNCQEFFMYEYPYDKEIYPARCDECGQALDWE